MHASKEYQSHNMGCHLSGTLFRIYFVCPVIEDSTHEAHSRMYYHHRHRIRVLLSELEEDLQQMVNHFHVIATAYGQEISIKKTNIMVVQCKRLATLMQSSPSIMIEGEELEVEQEFRYFGSIAPRMDISLRR